MLWNPTWLRRNGKIVYWGEHDPLGGNRRNVDEAVILTLAGSLMLTFPILSQARFSSFFIGLSLLSSLLPWICWPTTRFLHNSCPLCPSKVGVALPLCLCAFVPLVGCISSLSSTFSFASAVPFLKIL